MTITIDNTMSSAQLEQAIIEIQYNINKYEREGDQKQADAYRRLLVKAQQYLVQARERESQSNQQDQDSSGGGGSAGAQMPGYDPTKGPPNYVWQPEGPEIRKPAPYPSFLPGGQVGAMVITGWKNTITGEVKTTSNAYPPPGEGWVKFSFKSPISSPTPKPPRGPLMPPPPPKEPTGEIPPNFPTRPKKPQISSI